VTAADPTGVDVNDVQGNIVRPYGFGFARHLLVTIKSAAQAREALSKLLPQVTTGKDWGSTRPATTVNIALSFAGLEALHVPDASLNSFPFAFRSGMKRRALILGDTGRSAVEAWDPHWRGSVHALVSIHAQRPDALDPRDKEVRSALDAGFTVNDKENGAVLVVNGQPTKKEHFGYTDGIGQLEIEGFGTKKTTGDGKIAKNGWASVAPGELLLNYKNESGEYPEAPTPHVLGENGTFAVFRKLEQHVALFREYLDRHGKAYPGGREKLAAKFVGRWRDGTPLALSPDRQNPDLAADETKNNDFRYDGDGDGARCPLGAHIRRARPRDAMGFGGKLADARRIMRRGLPYGLWAPEDGPVDATPRGILFYAFNVDYERQFEFVQQQWLNYGNHFGQGNDKDVLLGDHDGTGKAVIQAVSPGEPPYLCTGLQRFVDMRGGEYFFMPGMRALEWIANLDD